MDRLFSKSEAHQEQKILIATAAEEVSRICEACHMKLNMPVESHESHEFPFAHLHFEVFLIYGEM